MTHTRPADHAPAIRAHWLHLLHAELRRAERWDVEAGGKGVAA